MRALAAALLGGGVLLTVVGPRPVRLADRVGVYLRMPRKPAERKYRDPRPLLRAGLDWGRRDLVARRAAFAGLGSFLGVLAAQGDFFVAGGARSMPGLAAIGAAAGLLGFNMWITGRTERRADRLRRELPTVTEALALRVLSGESIAAAIEGFTAVAHGVAADELARANDAYRAGSGLPEALQQASRDAAHADAARLYQLLGSAHRTGGRLAEALGELATDYRAGLARDLTAEGGRRAIATYGPILGLMIPVALLFLMYPTLVALRELSNGP